MVILGLVRPVRSDQLSQSGQPQFGQMSFGEVGLVRSDGLDQVSHFGQVRSGQS